MRKAAWSKTFACLAVCGLFALLGATTLFGQGSTGTITGVVTDPSGAVVPNASVTVLNQGMGVDYQFTTNSAGIYSVTSLIPGKYTVTVGAKGFKTYVNKDLTLTVNQILRIDVEMELGSETQTITVEAAAPLVNTEEGRLSGVVSGTQIQNMPLNGRNIYALMQLMPGAVDSTNVNLENASTGGLATNVNGTRLNFNGFLIDGVANKGLTGGSNSQPAPDFVQEFRIMTNNISAEYGNAAGSVTDVSIKSGTNALHGDVWEYFRNDKLNARNFFDGSTKQLWRQNQFGLGIGGPIKKDKLFFFGGFESQRFRTQVPALYTVETAAFRQAVQTALPNSAAALLYNDFPAPTPSTITSTIADAFDADFYLNPCFMFAGLAIGAPAFSGGPNWGNPQTTANNLGALIGVEAEDFAYVQDQIATADYDEDGTPDCAGLGFTAPPIQAGAISRNTPYLGQANASFGTRTTGVFQNGDQYIARVDYQGDKTRIYGRFFYSVQKEPNYSTISSTVRGFTVPGDFGYPGGAFSVVHTFSPTIVNEARAGYTRNKFIAVPDPSQFGVPNINFDGGEMGFGSYSGYPQFFIENVYQFSDLVTVIKGKHNMKMGGEVRFNQENSEFNVGRPSMYFFDMLYFAADLPYWSAAGVNPELVSGSGGHIDTNIRAWRNREYGFFFQDDWKVGSRLTLNFGLRWDYDEPHREKYGVATNFRFASGGLAGVNCQASVGGQCAAPLGSTVSPNGGFVPADRLNEPDRNNFAPRIGFAWDPFGNGKTAIRGGFAITYQTNIFNNLSNSRWNLPFYSFNIACPLCGFGALPLYGPTNPDGTRSGAAPSYSGAPANPGQGPAGLGFAGNLMGWFPTSPNLAFLTGIPDPDGLSNPYVQSGFFGIQREISPSTVLEVNWVGTYGKNLFWAENPNRVVNGFARTALTDPCTGAVLDDPAGVGTALLNPCFGTMRTWKNSVNSNYNALQVSFNRKMSRGFAYTTAYTWSHSLDFRSDWHALTSGGSANWQNSFGSSGYSLDPTNIGLEYGNSNFDIRHRLAMSIVWEMPWLKDQRGAVGKVFGGWQTNYNIALQSGFPFTIGTREDANQDGIPSDRPNLPSFGNYFPFQPNHFVPDSSGQSLMQRMASSFPIPNGTNGALGRNTFPGPGLAVVDFSLFKKVAFTERYSAEFRAEFFNLFNRVNLFPVQARLDHSLFGLSTQAFDPRVIQFGLRFKF